MQPPQYPYPPAPQPPKRNAWQWYQSQSGCLKIIIALALIFVVLFVCSAAVSGVVQGVSQSSASTPTPTASTAPQNAVGAATSTPTPKPPTSHYPPKTKADIQALTALGDASAVHEFHSESVGLTGVCPQPKRLVTVDPGLTGKQLVEDLLAYFYANQLDNPCGAAVFAFHTQAEGNGENGYTAGRILLKVYDASGQINTDPNASGLKYTLTLDTGDALSAQDMDVSW